MVKVALCAIVLVLLNLPVGGKDSERGGGEFQAAVFKRGEIRVAGQRRIEEVGAVSFESSKNTLWVSLKQKKNKFVPALRLTGREV